MRKIFFSFALFCLAVGSQIFADVATPMFRSSHDDYRRSPKLEEFEGAQKNSLLEPADVARQFLREHSKSYGIDVKDENLVLSKVQQSLLGTHFHFQQQLNGTKVERGEVIVSVSRSYGAVYRAYNNFYPGSARLKGIDTNRLIGSERAYDVAWRDLKVHGKLQDAPKTSLVYRVDAKGKFRLVYLTYLNVSAPHGAWQHEVDAYTGKVLKRVDTAIQRKKTERKDPTLYTGVVLNRRAEFAAFQKHSTPNQQSPKTTIANGKGLVFDPDPRTTLNRSDLEDDAAAELFDTAYFERDLLDLTFDGTNYKLEGPWVSIADFDQPTNAPSTNPTGQWNAKRGTNAFNDVMTYFHIDQSQRYMQSLGFEGATAIQGGAIHADADGADGADNSFYEPGANRLSFGHGCVDDNEDSDVILHEYGHAINFSINTNWEGGDTGAMGEGFGDYWGASYSIATRNGMNYKPFEIYSWDGHGDRVSCWDGRVLNATDVMYDPSRTYGAHQGIENNRQSDELWSTPLFQTLVALVQQGVPRSEVDQIILESQFGLGADLKMPDLAQATIQTAKRLQPGKPHADVFLQKFVAQQIVQIPRAILAIDQITFEGLGENGVADPGESLTFKVSLKNRGTLNAQDLSASLTSDVNGATVTSGQTSFANVEMGSTVESRDMLALSLDSNLACGSMVKLNLSVNFTGGTEPSVVLPIEFRLGKAIELVTKSAPDVLIPDNNPTGISDVIAITDGENVSENLAVDINIQHPYISDLTVVLTSPKGTTVTLHDKDGGSADNIVGQYPKTLSPFEELNKIFGETLRGDWKLSVVDSSGSDEGRLVNWGLFDISRYECQ